MAKDLERDLGLFAVIAISMGAMIGSGIFILPGIAMAEAGPAVILAFVIAAILVVPAALSIAELGTAMPEAGGDYVFIERGLGPSFGTIAGLGTWLMLMLKGSLALYGGMFYINFIYELPTWSLALPGVGMSLPIPGVRALGITFALVLIAVNLVGVKQTGGLQLIMVIVMLVILSGFVAGSIVQVEGANFDGFFDEGLDGILTATALVLVSYAGVTKVAAVAEEIENPGRNLPLGLLLSLGVTAFLYALLVFVLVGVMEGDQLADSEEPMALATDLLFGGLTLGGLPIGFLAVATIILAALLALVSTANAGILTASRYPLALSRDNLFLDKFEYIHPRFNTPFVAILSTGAIIIFIVATQNVDEIAKMAGAFQILVYILVCGALIAFRERDLEWYNPDFLTPGYPWVQLFGIVSGIFIITQMETQEIVGSVGLVILGFIWFKLYAQKRVEREGVAKGLARREAGRQFVRDTEEQLEQEGSSQNHYEVLIPIRRDVTREQEDALIQMAAPIVRRRGGRIRVVRFDEVPDQIPLDTAAEELSEAEVEFEKRTDELVRYLEVPVEVGEIVSHDTRHAVVNFAERTGADLVLARREATSRLGTLFGQDADWIMEHAPCDVVFVQHEQRAEIDEIAVVTDRSPFNDPLKVELADAMADTLGASVRFLFAVSENAPDELLETIEEYHDDLDDLCTVPVESTIVRTDDEIEDLSRELESADLVMLSTVTHRRLPDLLIEQRSDRLAAAIEQPVLLVHSKQTRRGSFLRPILDRVLFD